MPTTSGCPFHPDNDDPEDCYYCRMAVSKLKLAYFVAWTTPEGAYIDEYVGETGIPVTPTIDRSPDEASS